MLTRTMVINHILFALLVLILVPQQVAIARQVKMQTGIVYEAPLSVPNSVNAERHTFARLVPTDPLVYALNELSNIKSGMTRICEEAGSKTTHQVNIFNKMSNKTSVETFQLIVTQGTYMLGEAEKICKQRQGFRPEIRTEEEKEDLRRLMNLHQISRVPSNIIYDKHTAGFLFGSDRSLVYPYRNLFPTVDYGGGYGKDYYYNIDDYESYYVKKYGPDHMVAYAHPVNNFKLRLLSPIETSDTSKIICMVKVEPQSVSPPSPHHIALTQKCMSELPRKQNQTDYLISQTLNLLSIAHPALYNISQASPLDASQAVKLRKMIDAYEQNRFQTDLERFNITLSHFNALNSSEVIRLEKEEDLLVPVSYRLRSGATNLVRRRKRVAPLVIAGGIGGTLVGANLISSSITGEAPFSWTGGFLNSLFGFDRTAKLALKELRLHAQILDKIQVDLQLNAAKINENSQLITKIFSLLSSNANDIQLKSQVDTQFSNWQEALVSIEIAVTQYITAITGLLSSKCNQYVIRDGELTSLITTYASQKGINFDPNRENLLCSAVSTDKGLYVTIKIRPIGRIYSGVLYKATPFPVYLNGNGFIPDVPETYFIMYAHSNEYSILTVQEYEACLRSPDCDTTDLRHTILPDSNCVVSSFKSVNMKCETRPVTTRSPFIRVYGNITVYSVPQNMTVSEKCPIGSSAQTFDSLRVVHSIGSFASGPGCIINFDNRASFTVPTLPEPVLLSQAQTMGQLKLLPKFKEPELKQIKYDVDYLKDTLLKIPTITNATASWTNLLTDVESHSQFAFQMTVLFVVIIIITLACCCCCSGFRQWILTCCMCRPMNTWMTRVHSWSKSTWCCCCSRLISHWFEKEPPHPVAMSRVKQPLNRPTHFFPDSSSRQEIDETDDDGHYLQMSDLNARHATIVRSPLNNQRRHARSGSQPAVPSLYPTIQRQYSMIDLRNKDQDTSCANPLEYRTEYRTPSCPMDTSDELNTAMSNLFYSEQTSLSSNETQPPTRGVSFRNPVVSPTENRPQLSLSTFQSPNPPPVPPPLPVLRTPVLNYRGMHDP